MSNMSYCRFENTFKDLADCEDALIEGDSLSYDEFKHAIKLVEACGRIINHISRKNLIDANELIEAIAEEDYDTLKQFLVWSNITQDE